MFDEWDGGYDTIRASTGATGKTLEGLGESMKRVGGKVTQPLSQVGEAIGEVNKRLGLTGAPLERMTKKFLDLDRLGMPTSIANVTRAFGDWGVKTGQQAAVMDKLFRASQLTGSSIDELTAAAVKFGAPLRQMGFSLDQSTAMLGKFEKEGVNTNLVMGSMRIALGKLAKQGKDPVKAFGEIVEQIKSAGSTAKANKLALELFGARAGPDMAAAIREGRFEIGELMKRIASGGDTIDKAAADTLDLSDKFAMLKNRVTGAVGPYGEFVALGAGAVASIGPMLLGVSQLTPIVSKLGTALKGTAIAQWLLNTALFGFPIVLIVAGLVALGIALYVAWKKSETFREIVTGAWEKVRDVAVAVFDKVKEIIGGAIDFIGDLVQKHPLYWLVTHLGDVKDAISNLVGGIVGFFRDLPGRIWDAIQGLASGAWSWLKGQFRLVVDFYGEKIRDLVGFFRSIPGRILELGESFVNAARALGGKLKDGAVEGVTGIAGRVWDVVNNIWTRFLEMVDTVKGWGSRLGGWIKEAIPDAIVGIGSAVWDKVGNVWEFLKDKAEAIKRWGKQIGTWIKNAIVGGIKGLGGAVWDAIRDELTSTDKSGFNIIKGLFSGGPKGREPASSPGPVGSGRLDISPKLWDEMALGHRMGLSVSPEGGYRPGDDGDHGKFPSHAIDMVGARMSDFATAMYGRSGIKDVIYGPHPFWQDNGRIISWAGFEQLRRDHAGSNAHVHASVFDRGGILAPGVNVVANLTGKPEPLVPAMSAGRGGSEVHNHFSFPHYVGDRDELKRAMCSAAQELERDGTPLVARPAPGFS